MVIIPEDCKYYSIELDHVARSDSLSIRRKSRLGLCSLTADDLIVHSASRYSDKKPASTEVFASMTGYAQSNVSRHHHHLHASPRGLTMDFEETLFRTCLHPALSPRLIQMIADVKYKGGRCKLPFYAHTCHNMWVGAVVMGTEVVVPVCKRYQVCLMHHGHDDSVEASIGDDNCSLDANGNKKCSVMASRPMLIDCPSSIFTDTDGGSSIVRLCHYQSGRLLQGIQLFSADGQTVASPIRLVFSFTETDQVFCTDPREEAALMKRPLVKSVYRCSAPIESGSGLGSARVSRLSRESRRIDGEGATLPPH